ncbi:photoreceptor cilium actin regulator [Ambystoma mexicanum]|uniref:photoreceptor cilium actin regulator n=1 Tax=Ambystoma mexicanum TaxID=8296 RepID=UPI0037E79257
MGCAPSHSGLIRSFTNNLASNRTPLSSVYKHNFPIGLLVESSSFSDTDGKSNRETIWKKQSVQKREPREQSSTPQIRHYYPNDSAQSDGQKDKSTSERMATDTDSGKPQKYLPEDKHLAKQSSTESEPCYCTKDHSASNPKKIRKSRSQKSGKQSRQAKKDKGATFSDTEIKVDFPDRLVQAHQNTYAYLNPNLSKYEAIISMANQATQTQLIMQQMVSFLSLRFDEINRTLEEIANDGEQLLKDVGKNLAWPLEQGDSREQPDLLPQLLQYTVNKMQVLNETVASLTSDVLHDTFTYLESAATNLKAKLKTKQMFDERLLQTMKLLESSAIGSVTSCRHDAPLYSEDSGIGADCESIKESFSSHKTGRQESSDSLGQVCPEGKRHHKSSLKNCSITVEQYNWILGKHTKDTVGPSGITKTLGSSSAVPNKYSSTSSSLTPNSQSSTATEPDIGKADDLTESTGEDDEYSIGDNIDKARLAEMLLSALPRRPMTSPAITGVQRSSTKWIDNPPNEEMTMKIKDAISEKIKFMPVHSGKNIWTDEEGQDKINNRPSTASGGRTQKCSQKRSRSAESLKSQAEDPTLLELQRTQKVLHKRLDNMHTSSMHKCPDAKIKSPDQWEPAPIQHTDCMMLTSSMNKLKASLEKHFSILPNHDKFSFTKWTQNGSNTPEEKTKKPEISPLFIQDSKQRMENEGGPAVIFDSGKVSPRQSVRKLIETFSPSENIMRPSNVRSLGPLKCIKRYGVPVLPPSIPVYRMFEPLNDKRFGSFTDASDRPFDSSAEDISQASTTTFPPIIPASMINSDASEGCFDDLESLPPPPPEILLDTSSGSFQSEETITTTESDSSETSCEYAKKDLETPRKMTMSEKMKVSFSAIDLLPSKPVNSMPSNKVGRSGSKSNSYSLELHNTHLFDSDKESLLACQRDQEKEEAAQLYRQSHKIIPLQNTGSVSRSSDSEESKDSGSNVCLVQRQPSSISLRKIDKSPRVTRRNSPTKSKPSLAPTEKVGISPTRYMHMSPAQPPPSSFQKHPIAPVSSGGTSPPVQRKLPSPPPTRKLPSPALGRRPSNPPVQRRLASPPTSRRESSPPPYCRTPSPPPPPLSPSASHRRLRNTSDGSDTSKVGSNAQSIFCPSSSTLFEAKPPSPPSRSSSEDSVAQCQNSVPAWKNSFALRQFGDQQRRVAMSAVNPQPFVRRCLSDRRSRVKLPLPVSIPPASAGEPAYIQLRNRRRSGSPHSELDDLGELIPKKEHVHWASGKPSVIGYSLHRAEDPTWKGVESCNSMEEPDEHSRISSSMELCIVGQGLQKD